MFSGLIIIDIMDIGICICLISIGIGILCFLVNLVLYLKSVLFKTTWVSNVSNRHMIQEIILFTNDILWKQGISHFPEFKISNYPHKKYLGAFDGQRIIVYVKNVQNVPMLTVVVLHEVRHYIQAQVEVKNYARYERYSKAFGYVLNPLEIQCHLFALKWFDPCIEYLFSRNIIKKCV